MPLSLENVSYVYGERTPFEYKALNNLSLTFKDGMITGLMGHTGSGKSTAAQMLNGLLKPSEGRVILDGEDINESKKSRNDAKFKVGLVFQYPEYQLFKETVWEDIAYGPRNMKLSEDEVKKRVKDAAELVGLTRQMLEKSPFELSGGQKRRAAIAGIIAMKPRFLILDEPAAGLDPAGRDDILSQICEYRNSENSSVVIISHSMEDMAKYCDEIAVMDDGSLCMYGTPSEVFSQSEKLKNAGLNVPQITDFMDKLYNCGIDVDKSVFTVESAAEQLIKLYSKVRNDK